MDSVSPPVTAPHGSEIIALATTVDGAAVASADRLGGIRLWTALDGTREPVVIRGTAPRQIAVWRDSDGFALAILDAAGGVQVIRTTAAGAVRGRATVSGGAASEIASTLEGLLILRSEQTLELVDAGGAPRSRLAPEPGSRIATLVVRAGRILALIQEDEQVHGRWVVVQRGARWGGDTPRLPFPIARAVLSPDGRRLAVTRPRRLHPALIDLAKGTADSTPLCVSRAWPHGEGDNIGDDKGDERELLRNDNAPVPLGFLTDEVIACSVINQLTWWGTGGETYPSSAGSLPVAHLPIALTDRALIVGTGASLALASPELDQFPPLRPSRRGSRRRRGVRARPRGGAAAGGRGHDAAAEPDGARIAAFAAADGPRLRLLTASGDTRWETTLWSSSAVEWTPAGELLVQFPSGVARIDLDTGALADRRCGWSFGLAEQVQPARDSGPSICEAERP